MNVLRLTSVLLMSTAGLLTATGCKHSAHKRREPVQRVVEADIGATPRQTARRTETDVDTTPKSEGCVRNGGRPDPRCTPGIVNTSVTAQHVCTPGYSESVRNVSKRIKAKVFEMYGDMPGPRGTFEVDHLISLELGGSNDIRNLWPQHAEPKPGFREKDVVENYLHNEVCKGRMTLAEAQRLIVGDWEAVYKKIQESKQK